ncbi:MAG: DUF2304 domain-containing protein [Planctomycetes bacterium]|nr:DUF2304 domain-containing protein [Planctomycetota bacterium]
MIFEPMFALLQDPDAVALEPLPGRQKLTAIVVAVGVLLLVLELVRRRKLREEYSWFWAATAMALIVLAVYDGCLVELSRWIGAASPVSTLFFGAFLFLLALALQFSIRLSRLTHRNRTLAQRLALLEEQIERMRQQDGNRNPAARSRPDADRDEVA